MRGFATSVLYALKCGYNGSIQLSGGLTIIVYNFAEFSCRDYLRVDNKSYQDHCPMPIVVRFFCPQGGQPYPFPFDEKDTKILSKLSWIAPD